MRAFRLKPGDLTPALRKQLGVTLPSSPRRYPIHRSKPLFTRCDGVVHVLVTADSCAPLKGRNS